MSMTFNDALAFVRHDVGKPSNGRMTLRYWDAKGEHVSRRKGKAE